MSSLTSLPDFSGYAFRVCGPSCSFLAPMVLLACLQFSSGACTCALLQPILLPRTWPLAFVVPPSSSLLLVVRGGTTCRSHVALGTSGNRTPDVLSPRLTFSLGPLGCAGSMSCSAFFSVYSFSFELGLSSKRIIFKCLIWIILMPFIAPVLVSSRYVVCTYSISFAISSRCFATADVSSL